MPEPNSQRQIAHDFVAAHGIVRLAELRDAGATAAGFGDALEPTWHFIRRMTSKYSI